MRPERALRLLPAGALLLVLSSCSDEQSPLAPTTDSSERVADLWWLMLVGSAIVTAVVITLVLVAVLRRRGRPPQDRSEVASGERFVAISGIVVPGLALVALFVVTLGAMSASARSGDEEGLVVEVTGRQWFWDVTYDDGDGGFRTANEIHLPVGEPVTLRVESGDVLHSLWVPRLIRKIDMIPGQTNEVTFVPEQTGTFRGQCSEFCGLQHAKMALYVVVEPRERFLAWAAQQARPAAVPTTEQLVAGQQTFLGSACVYCHTIDGTNASGTIGPDLTHVSSRLSLAAGTLPNSRGYMAGWILDPQHVKPGNRMPATNLEGPELQALLDYLDSLE